MICRVKELFDWLMPACLRFVRKEVKEITPTLDTQLAVSAMRIFHSLLDEFRPQPKEGAPTPGKYPQ